MADKNTEKEQTPSQVARAAVSDADPPEDADTFPVERLIEEAGAFLGEPPHVVAGALHGVSKKNLTVEEAQAAVKDWLKAPVKEA